MSEYVMTAAAEAEAVAEILEIGERLDDRFVMAVGDRHSVAGRLGRIVERRVFDAEWGSHTPELMTREYARWEDDSTSIVVVDAQGVIGAARMALSPNWEVPTKTEFDLGFTDGSLRLAQGLSKDDPVWDLPTIAIEPRGRGSEALGYIIGEWHRQALRRAPEASYFCMIQMKFYRQLCVWGVDVSPLADLSPLEYLEVLSQPTYLPPRPMTNLVRRPPFGPLSEALLSRVENEAVVTFEGDTVVLDLRSPAETALSSRL